MIQNVESKSFNLRYESYRMKHKLAEDALLCSIFKNGIRDPLLGVDINNERILIKGFKRYGCAKKLGPGIVPYCWLGSDEIRGIIKLILISNSKSLFILEQAKLIDDLKKILNILSKDSKGLFRFLCQLCNEFQTADKTNLAQGFRYEINFNPIYLVMIIKGIGFVKTVKYLKTFLLDTSDSHMEKRQEMLVGIGKSISMRVNR